MALTILISGTNYEDSIRIKLFGANDTDLLPDSAINNPTFIEKAERIIKAKFTGWSGLTGDDADWLRDAVLAQTCALLAPSVRNLMTTSEQVERLKITKDIDPDGLETSFYGEVDYCLSQIGSFSGSLHPRISGTIDRSPVMFNSISSTTSVSGSL